MSKSTYIDMLDTYVAFGVRTFQKLLALHTRVYAAPITVLHICELHSVHNDILL